MAGICAGLVVYSRRNKVQRKYSLCCPLLLGIIKYLLYCIFMSCHQPMQVINPFLFRCTEWSETVGDCIPTSTPFHPSPPDCFPRRPWGRRGGSASLGISGRGRCPCPRLRPCELYILTCDQATQVKKCKVRATHG